jgi:hypothetical protein
VLVHAAAADVEGRMNVLLCQLDDADHRGIGEFSSLLFSSFFVYISFLIMNGISCVPEVTVELEGLRTAVDAFLGYLGVAPGTREDRLWVACHRVTAAIESGVRRSTGVSLAMAELSVGADLTEISGFPVEEPLRLHEDLVACYGLAKEAVAVLVPAQQILAELPHDATS